MSFYHEQYQIVKYSLETRN